MPMPYTLSKGRILSVLEDLLNPHPDRPEEMERLRKGLADLRNPDVLLTSIGLVDSTNIETPGVDARPLVERLNWYWFGREEDGSGGWSPQAPFGPDHRTTGYWTDYYGNVEAVLRETLIRTIEVSFGLEPGGELGIEPPRQWEVELFWKCPNPWCEGWVTWRRSRLHRDQGQVTSIIATPTDSLNQLRVTPANPPHGVPPLEQPSGVSGDDHGMWLVTQPRHLRQTEDPERVGSTSSILKPGETWHDEGDVVVLQLTEDVGGPAPFGRPYIPPTETES